jgi:hypothetical protein
MQIHGNFTDAELYKITVKSLFESTQASLDLSGLEILRNLVETIVILEIVPENTFSEAYTRVLGVEVDLSEKMTVALEFITSLEFIREKYKTKYSYNNLLTSFL